MLPTQDNVWTPVVSIRREDAERLHFTSAEKWRNVVMDVLPDIAKGYKISLENLQWYAALHEKEKGYHIHMVIYSSNPKQGYLNRQGIRSVRSAFTTHMFKEDLHCLYARQTEARNALQADAHLQMQKLIYQMEHGEIRNEKIEKLITELSERLRETTGRKVYGYLPPRVKRIVDEIVDELAKDERVAQAYEMWQQMRDEVCRSYSNTPLKRLPLSQQKEFKPIVAVTNECPNMLVGAGTVVTLAQCKQAVAHGAKFIVSPGYSEEVVDWCVKNSIPIIPGCATPTEIMMALAHNLKVLKFFPANVYGGVEAMRALSGPFMDVKFIPTGGINGENLTECLSQPFIHAVGGSWLCKKADISAGNFEVITELCKEARQKCGKSNMVR